MMRLATTRRLPAARIVTSNPSLADLLADATKAVLLSPLFVLVSLIGKGEPRTHYSGECGKGGDLKEYDSLTQAEHDELGAFAGWSSYGKGTGE